MIRYYYTLDDILALTSSTWLQLNPGVKGFFSLIQVLKDVHVETSLKYKNDDENDQEVFEVIRSRFGKSYIMFIDKEVDDIPSPSEMRETFMSEIAPQIYGWLVGEKQKYDLVLNELNSITDWKAPITTTTTNKFNDTPQENVDGSADPFTSNITNTTNSTDGASPAVRYAEIREVADKILSDVADGFRQFVIYA